MFSRAFVFATLALCAVAAPGGGPATTCSNGPVQCCDQVKPANQVDFLGILPANLIGNVPAGIQSLQTPVGINCVPVAGQGGAGNSCATQATCCENNNFGLIAIGCTPPNVGL